MKASSSTPAMGAHSTVLYNENKTTTSQVGVRINWDEVKNLAKTQKFAGNAVGGIDFFMYYTKVQTGITYQNYTYIIMYIWYPLKHYL